jgi:hypothetical protein
MVARQAIWISASRSTMGRKQRAAHRRDPVVVVNPFRAQNCRRSQLLAFCNDNEGQFPNVCEWHDPPTRLVVP